jgi:membrane protein DedA with SNARE-associated domain
MDITQQIASQMDNPFILFVIFFILAITNLFFPPVPLESAVLFGGFWVGTGKGSLISIILASAFGMFSGSMILFWMARRYGYSIIGKTPFRKVLTGPALPKLEHWFHQYGFWAVFFGKIIPGMSLGVVIFCGILHWKTFKAGAAILGSNLLFFSILGITGQAMGRHWDTAAGWLKRLNLWIIYWVVLLIAGLLIYFWFKRRQKVH